MRYLVICLSFFVLIVAGYLVAQHVRDLFLIPPGSFWDALMMTIAAVSLMLAKAISDLPRVG